MTGTDMRPPATGSPATPPLGFDESHSLLTPEAAFDPLSVSLLDAESADPAEVVSMGLPEFVVAEARANGVPAPPVRICASPDSLAEAVAVMRLLRRGQDTPATNLTLTAAHATLAVPANRRALTGLAEDGVRVRTCQEVMPDMITLGTTVGVVTVKDIDGTRRVRVFRSPHKVDHMLRWQFSQWYRSAALEELRDVLDILDNPMRVEVMAHLSAGTKDEVAARGLNVSVRTYHRHVAAIMSTLGVHARFAAGMRAQQTGLSALCSMVRKGRPPTQTSPDAPGP